jgi:putative ABC transport system permease protein
MTVLRQAFRTLVTHRGFTAVAVTTLAIGIGAATAIFSVVNAVLLRPLPYPSAGQLAMVWLANPQQGIDKDISPYPTFREFRSNAHAFSHLAAYSGLSMNLTGAGNPQRIRGAQVSEGFFAMMGVQPLLGRALRDDEHQPGQHEVVVVGHGLWTHVFGANPSAVGQTMTLNGSRYLVVGVMPPGFAFPGETEFWIPLAPVPSLRALFEARGAYWLTITGRVQEGVSQQSAVRELNAIVRRLDREYPQTYTGQSAVIESLHESTVGQVRTALLVLQGAVLLLLAIACANVANLLFVRATGRYREVAIRVALGASRGRIVRQLLVESIALAALGSASGILLATTALRALHALAPENLPRLEEVRLDAPVVLFAAALAVVTALVFGLAPAMQLASPDLAGALKPGRSTDRHGAARARTMLVAAQLGLALMLLIGAGLLLRSFSRVIAIDPGFVPEGVLTVELALSGERYQTAAQRGVFYQRLLERLAIVPGVEAAGAIRDVLLSRLPNSGPIAIEGRGDLSEADRNFPVAFDPVTPGFFRSLRIPIVSGRTFTDADHANAPPVAVVNQALVRRFFPRADPIGRRVTLDDPKSPQARWITIVGVAGDARRSGLDQPARPELYSPHLQRAAPAMTLTIRTTLDPMSVVSSVRAAVTELDPELPLARVATLDALVGTSLAARRFSMLLLSVFSGLALLLAAIGIYSVAAYAVSRRAREFGVRLALGAQRASVMRMVLGEAARIAIAGAALGVIGALALTRVLASLLYEVSATDAWTFAMVTALLVVVATLACVVPARRATRIDPAVSLRTE